MEINFIKQTTSDKENSNKYLLKQETEELGYAYIYHNTSINNVYVFIHPQHRSNGFGFTLFNLVINELKTITNYQHIELDIDKANTHLNNIIAKCGGLILSEDNEKHWIIKL